MPVFGRPDRCFNKRAGPSPTFVTPKSRVYDQTRPLHARVAAREAAARARPLRVRNHRCMPMFSGSDLLSRRTGPAPTCATPVSHCSDQKRPLRARAAARAAYGAKSQAYAHEFKLGAALKTQPIPNPAFPTHTCFVGEVAVA
eukprot:6306567-Alexandrium_andersonii.AAC.2